MKKLKYILLVIILLAAVISLAACNLTEFNNDPETKDYDYSGGAKNEIGILYMALSDESFQGTSTWETEYTCGGTTAKYEIKLCRMLSEGTEYVRYEVTNTATDITFLAVTAEGADTVESYANNAEAVSSETLPEAFQTNVSPVTLADLCGRIKLDNEEYEPIWNYKGRAYATLNNKSGESVSSVEFEYEYADPPEGKTFVMKVGLLRTVALPVCVTVYYYDGESLTCTLKMYTPTVASDTTQTTEDYQIAECWPKVWRLPDA